MPELAGIDLRGLGLLLTKNKAETSVRCGVASFKVADGTLTTQSLVLDTEPVLITGDGTIDLESESVDLTLHGRPKHLRLFRLRAPVTLRGPLKHPKIGIEAGKTAAQAGAAVALGVVLTPLAAVLAFVDPGLAKDADCGALLAENKNRRPAQRHSKRSNSLSGRWTSAFGAAAGAAAGMGKTCQRDLMRQPAGVLT